MKTTKNMVGVLVIGLAVLTGAPAQAQDADASFARLVAKWKAERQELVLSMVRGWLRGADTVSQQDRLTRLVQLDVRLANEPDVPLYVTQFKDPSDVEQSVRDVVNAELRNAGVACHSKALFQGKKFELRRTDTRGPTSPQFSCLKWGKGAKK